jgi:hypothetical protein
MKLTTVWIVRDPNELCELVDIVWEQKVDGLDRYILGGEHGTWVRERHTVYADRDEAVADAIRRLVRIRPEREGWINDEAYREFGFGAPR